MPKMRNSDTEIGGFTQWLARKMRRHHPLEELKIERRHRADIENIYAAKGRASVFILAEDDGCIVYKEAGRVFMTSTREITEADELDSLLNKPMIAVGN